MSLNLDWVCRLFHPTHSHLTRFHVSLNILKEIISLISIQRCYCIHFTNKNPWIQLHILGFKSREGFLLVYLRSHGRQMWIIKKGRHAHIQQVKTHLLEFCGRNSTWIANLRIVNPQKNRRLRIKRRIYLLLVKDFWYWWIVHGRRWIYIYVLTLLRLLDQDC